MKQTLVSIAVSPASATVHLKATKQFAASANDQFGRALLVQPSFAWSLSSSLGTVSRKGLYTAPNRTGNVTLRAKSGGITGTAAITVDRVQLRRNRRPPARHR
ncbi:MAG: hypothetical protein U0800_10375 [Isosphaeraceae bacterium]